MKTMRLFVLGLALVAVVAVVAVNFAGAEATTTAPAMKATATTKPATKPATTAATKPATKAVVTTAPVVK